MKLYTAFANTHAAECEAAIGVLASDGSPRRAAYVYEHERGQRAGIDMNPQRAFFDSEQRFWIDGRGFPDPDEHKINLAGVRFVGTDTDEDPLVCCLNMEFYGPRWDTVKRPMQLLGLLRHGTKPAAQSALAMWLACALERARCHLLSSDVVGLYGWAPFPRQPNRDVPRERDLERAVLLHATAYMPAPYVATPAELGSVGSGKWSFEQRDLDLVDMPRREVIPVVCGRCVYGDQPLVPAEAWARVWERCAKWGATRAILWGDAGPAEAVEFARRTNEAMRQGAKLAGVGEIT